MTKKGLEKVVSDSRKISDIMHKVLGVSIEELSKDISEKLKKSPLVDFDIDTNLKFKEAKKKFKQGYLRKLLRISYGNISDVAKKAGVDRRSIHRIIKEARIDIATIREEMLRPYEIKQKAVGNVIEDVLDSYKTVLHPEKLKQVYDQVSNVSKDILEEVEVEILPIKEAEQEFEKEYLKKAISENKNLKQTAKKIGLAYETLLRKMKSLKL